MKTTLLAEDDCELLLEWFAAEKAIDGFAAGNDILFSTRAAVCYRLQVLDTCIGLGQFFAAEETFVSLLKQEAIKLLHVSRFLTRDVQRELGRVRCDL